MAGLSVVIIALNEEDNLPRCLASVKWADEIVLVDSGSSDRTMEIGRTAGATVVSFGWQGFGAAKKEGVNRAAGPWILSIDADEEVTPELRSEITAAVAGDDSRVGYFIPRRTRFLGRWIYHCGWYPDPVLRLFRKDRGDFDEAVVHERVDVEGRVGRLSNDLLHYSYPTLEAYFEKFNRYTTMAAQAAYERGRRAGAFDILARPVANFIKQYFLKAGFLDGLEGLLISVFSSCHVMTKYAKLRHLWKTNDGRQS